MLSFCDISRCVDRLFRGCSGGDFLAEPLKDFGIKIGRLAVCIARHKESPEDLDFCRELRGL